MNVNELIENTLKPLNIPIKHHIYVGKETTYVTFFEYLEKGEDYYDDTEKSTGHYIQIDLWSKEELESIKKDTVNLLIKNGFVKKNIYDFYELDTKIFHKCLRFFYYTEN